MTRDEARKVLGVRRGASQKDIKRAFRKKCFHCHPDAGGNSRDFLRVKEALDTLNSPSSPNTTITKTRTTQVRPYRTEFNRSYRYSRAKTKEPITDTNSCLQLIAMFLLFMTLFITQCT